MGGWVEAVKNGPEGEAPRDPSLTVIGAQDEWHLSKKTVYSTVQFA